MRDLLLNCWIFVDVGCGSYIQVAGTPITDSSITAGTMHLAPSGENKRAAENKPAPKPKRAKIDEPVSAAKLPDRTTLVTTLPFARRRIFYTRPIRGRKNSIIFGLPKSHIFNATRHVPESQAGRQVLGRMFPRQFGMYSVFEEAQKTKDLNSLEWDGDDVELEPAIKKKLPWRLKTAQGLVSKMLYLHRKLNYAALLDQYCPRPAINIAAMPRTSYLTAHSTHFQVWAFILACLKRVIPRSFWGTDHNRQVIFTSLKLFIRLRRFETLSLNNVLKCFKISDCSWTNPSRAQARHPPPSESRKRLELVLEFLWWIHQGVVIPLLKTNFYVTESAPHRNRIFYFRHDAWDTLTRPVLTKLIGQCGMFKPLPQKAAGATSKEKMLSYSYVRLLPKDTGVRMIMNLKRQTVPGQSREAAKLPRTSSTLSDESITRSKFGQSINTILQNAFQVLCLEKRRNPHLLGASVLGLNDIYLRLSSYKAGLLNQYGNVPPLYAIKLDIQACFDTIRPDLMMNIIKDVLCDEEYLVAKHSLAYPSMGRIKKRYVRTARPGWDWKQFSDFVDSVKEGVKGTVFVDQVVYNLEETQILMALLTSHIRHNLIKLGKRLYQQIIGIPQGSILSTLLCSFYYAHLEKMLLQQFMNDDTIILRYVDDFLVISSKKKDVEGVWEVLKDGSQLHNCTINHNKTLSTFPIPSHPDINFISPNQPFPWCGLMLHFAQLEVSPDIKLATHISNTLTIPLHVRPGMHFQQKAMAFLRPKMHALLLDTNFSTEERVIKNVSALLKAAAGKVWAYVRVLNNVQESVRHGLRDQWLFVTVKNMLRLCFMLIQNMMKGRVATSCGGKCELRWPEIEWCVASSFNRMRLR
ncbi:hypothetical protein HDU85_005674 [Gaertneriomyces sp. JEL0708]|nr:hypothetical protein HDU85_005674 [Gaertneriomyces sp. JEL0708]